MIVAFSTSLLMIGQAILLGLVARIVMVMCR
jgi:hypothetical protein